MVGGQARERIEPKRGEGGRAAEQKHGASEEGAFRKAAPRKGVALLGTQPPRGGHSCLGVMLSPGYRSDSDRTPSARTEGWAGERRGWVPGETTVCVRVHVCMCVCVCVCACVLYMSMRARFLLGKSTPKAPWFESDRPHQHSQKREL